MERAGVLSPGLAGVPSRTDSSDAAQTGHLLARP
jgi:hypothetical protein